MEDAWRMIVEDALSYYKRINYVNSLNELNCQRSEVVNFSRKFGCTIVFLNQKEI